MSKRAEQSAGNTAMRMKPVSLGIRNALLTKRNASLVATTLLASSVAFGQANQAPALEEIVVTARNANSLCRKCRSASTCWILRHWKI